MSPGNCGVFSASERGDFLKNTDILQLVGRVTCGINLSVRMAAQLKRLKMENAQLKEMMGIKDARMIRLDPKRRPYYSPTERMRIFLLNKKITDRLRRFTLDE